mgnify:CR=1 FL=1
MKCSTRSMVWIVLLCILMLTSTVFAAKATNKRLQATASPTQEVTHEHGWDKFWSDFHNPTEDLEMGMDFRFRTIYAQNIDTLNDGAVDSSGRNRSMWDFQRYRTRWWTKWMMSDNVDLNTRLVWEFRTWHLPARKPQDTDFDEALLDKLNFVVRDFLGMPVTAKIGRQDLIFGKGWLVLDGTPLDGSRTIFTDAARFTFDWKEESTTVDLVYIHQNSRADKWLHPINDRENALTEQDENGAILYYTNKANKKANVELYFMYKNDNPVDYTPRNFPTMWSQKAEIFTYGGALSGDLDENWNYRVEGALQKGTHDPTPATAGTSRHITAYGANALLTYFTRDEQDTSYHVGYEYNSGDDPSSSDYGQFDPLWAEWPRWSELYIYTYSRETMIAESTNLHRFNIGHKFKPCEKWQICTDYHYLLADENTTTGSSSFMISPHSKFRGQLFTLWLNYKMNPQLYGHILGEYLIPGSYYDQSNRNHAYFLRFNIEYRF